jgi:hypothetical protein
LQRSGFSATQTGWHLEIILEHSGIRRIRSITRFDRTQITSGLPAGVLAPDLGLKITGLAAGTAIIDAVFAQANFIETLAQAAVFVAGAGSFRLIANHALEFPGHSGRLARFGVSGNRTMVDGLAMDVAAPQAAHESKIDLSGGLH